MDSLWLTSKEVAARFRIHASYVRKNAAKFGGVKEFGHWKFPLSIVERLEARLIREARSMVEEANGN